MVMKYRMDCPFIIGQFEKHNELKEQVLAAINEAEADHLVEPEDNMDISRCDWRLGRWDHTRKWFQSLQPHWHDHMMSVSKELGYEFFRLKEIWFQQYNTNAHHGWHVHGSNWTNVYFLEMPEDSPKTQFINAFNQTEIGTFEIKEGDILTFPSFVVHRAPINLSNNRKTIISWNMDTEIAPGLYQE
jgi:hypothetical protein